MAVSHLIHDNCIGCTACTSVCPTDAITGERKQLHVIEPKLCIDCGACSRVCPVLAISDQNADFQPRIPKRSEWPKPVIFDDSCTGCSFCVDICPFDCLELSTDEGHFQGVARLIKPNECVSCKECEEVCAKGAILVLDPKTWPTDLSA